MKVVLDTNVIVSALIRARTPPDMLLRSWRRGTFQIVTSMQLLRELGSVLGRQRMRRYLSEDNAASIMAELIAKAIIVDPREPLRIVPSDPADDRVLEAAISGTASYICSGDADLLALGEFRGIAILTPAHLLAVLGAESAE